MLSQKTKAIGICELLDTEDGVKISQHESGDFFLSVSGEITVLGEAFVYPQDGTAPEKEVGIWLINLGKNPRNIYFKAHEVDAIWLQDYTQSLG